MKNLLAGGFLFVGGAIIMTTTQFGHVIPMIGAGCALLGLGMLLYYLFSVARRDIPAQYQTKAANYFDNNHLVSRNNSPLF